jgi:hypothetical protein
VFCSLNHALIHPKLISGDILVNGKKNIGELSPKVYFMDRSPVLPLSGTVLGLSKMIRPEMTQELLGPLILRFFEKVSIPAVFDPQTDVPSLPTPHKQLLNLFKICELENYDIVVIVNGLYDVNIVARKLIEKFLIASSIPVIISITNIKTISSLSPTHFDFSDLALSLKEQPSPLPAAQLPPSEAPAPPAP